MACGCPVVTSRVASIPEVGGDAAFYLENPADVSGLAAVLADLTSARVDREHIVRKGLVRASRFRWEDTAARTFNVLKEFF